GRRARARAASWHGRAVARGSPRSARWRSHRGEWSDGPSSRGPRRSAGAGWAPSHTSARGRVERERPTQVIGERGAGVWLSPTTGGRPGGGLCPLVLGRTGTGRTPAGRLLLFAGARCEVEPDELIRLDARADATHGLDQRDRL